MKSQHAFLLLIMGMLACQQYDAGMTLPAAKYLEHAPTEYKPAALPVAATVVEPMVQLQIVRFADFEKALAQHKGKIIVLDFWATWCVPCKAEFHHLVEMHQQLESKGVVCISLSLDEADEKEAVVEFLKSKKATFANYLIDDEEAKWQQKWKLGGIPIVFVYGKDNQLAKRFDNSDPDNQFTYKQVNSFVQELLAK